MFLNFLTDDLRLVQNITNMAKQYLFGSMHFIANDTVCEIRNLQSGGNGQNLARENMEEKDPLDGSFSTLLPFSFHVIIFFPSFSFVFLSNPFISFLFPSFHLFYFHSLFFLSLFSIPFSSLYFFLILQFTLIYFSLIELIYGIILPEQY